MGTLTTSCEPSSPPPTEKHSIQTSQKTFRFSKRCWRGPTGRPCDSPWWCGSALMTGSLRWINERVPSGSSKVAMDLEVLPLLRKLVAAGFKLEPFSGEWHIGC
jgi:hypothetical protein